MDDLKTFQSFVDSLKGVISNMAEIELEEVGECYEEEDDLASFGATVAVAFVGKLKGRMLLDFEQNAVIKLANIINGDEYTTIQDEMVIATLSEVGNIVAGEAITMLNNVHCLGIRLAPPIVFLGEGVVIGINGMQSISLILSCKFGKLKVNLAHEGS